MMRLYYYAQCCQSRAAKIAGTITDEQAAEIDAIEDSVTREEETEFLGIDAPSDCNYFDGTEAELIARARARLAIRNDTRPGGAGDAYQWQVARNILEHFEAETCGTLDDLLGQMLAGTAGDWTSLDTFGEMDQDEFERTVCATSRPVWSWDDTRAIIGACEDDLEIVTHDEIRD